MTDFLEPGSYEHLCDECRVVLAQITQMFNEGLMSDTDDQEAPCNFMYDNKLFCAGSACGGFMDEEEPLYLIHILNDFGREVSRVVDPYGRNHALLEAIARTEYQHQHVTVEEWEAMDFRVPGTTIWASISVGQTQRVLA